VETTRFRSGWVTFAGVVAAIIAVWNILTGIAAIAEDDQTEALNEVLFGVSITAWGWFWLIIGVIQLARDLAPGWKADAEHGPMTTSATSR
jgi:Kef-type K+ transport system membrane component KefB